jgi:hypothetical protein
VSANIPAKPPLGTAPRFVVSDIDPITIDGLQCCVDERICSVRLVYLAESIRQLSHGHAINLRTGQALRTSTSNDLQVPPFRVPFQIPSALYLKCLTRLLKSFTPLSSIELLIGGTEGLPNL